MKSILLMLAAALIALTSVSPVLAADPSNPTPPLPQPGVQDGRTASATPMVFRISTPQVFTQWELRSAEAYRQAPGTYVESPGGSSGSAGTGAGAGGDGS